MNEILLRVRKVFTASGKSQSDFAKIINVTPAYVWKLLNKDDATPSERLLEDICEKLNVNKTWLFTGEGGDHNIFSKPSPADRFSINLGKLSSTQNETAINMINAIAEIEPEKLKYIEKFMMKCLGLDSKS